MRRFPTIFISAAFAVALPLAALPASAWASGDDISKINGSVTIEANQPAGDVSTVNGSVHIGDNARVEKANTVNGSIDLGDKAQAKSLETVNGAVALGNGSRVSGDVTAVNGGLHLAQDAEVLGKVSNVNGVIALEAAHVAGGVDTVAGDITVGANSHVEGGILVDEPHGWIHKSNHTPVIVIGPHAVVQGTLEFRREVMLNVSDSAQIGTVKGATAIKFSGATP